MVELNQEHINYLRGLRDSGTTNMYGAAPYLEGVFGLDKYEARELLKQWMNYEERRCGTDGDPAQEPGSRD